jgi:hypothetical protein
LHTVNTNNSSLHWCLSWLFLLFFFCIVKKSSSKLQGVKRAVIDHYNILLFIELRVCVCVCVLWKPRCPRLCNFSIKTQAHTRRRAARLENQRSVQFCLSLSFSSLVGTWSTRGASSHFLLEQSRWN